jgi:hypothetical protein
MKCAVRWQWHVGWLIGCDYCITLYPSCWKWVQWTHTYCILGQERYRKKVVTHRKVIQKLHQISTTKGGTPKAKQADRAVARQMNGLMANLTFRGSALQCVCNAKKPQWVAVCFCKMSCGKVFHKPGKKFELNDTVKGLWRHVVEAWKWKHSVCTKQNFLPDYMVSRPPLWSRGESSWLQIQMSGFYSWHYEILWEVVGLEQSPLSLMSTIEELRERKVAVPV